MKNLCVFSFVLSSIVRFSLLLSSKDGLFFLAGTKIIVVDFLVICLMSLKGHLEI